MLETERIFFESVLAKLLQVCPGSFVVIMNQELIGTYQTMSDALSEGARRFGLESFLIRRVDMATETASIPALSLGILSAKSFTSSLQLRLIFQTARP